MTRRGATMESLRIKLIGVEAEQRGKEKPDLGDIVYPDGIATA